MTEHIGLFSNFWWATVANDYSIMIFLIVSAILTVLKIWAVLSPGAKTNSILCLLQGWFYGVPGIKKDATGEVVKPDPAEKKVD
jgi:hypothetical protein